MRKEPNKERSALWWLAAAAGSTALAAATGCTIANLVEARALARASEPFEQLPAQPLVRMLVLGDSTAVGTGASKPEASVAGLLGTAHPGLLVHNRARDGARFDDLAAQVAAVPADAAYDVVLISAGGNDVIRGSDSCDMAQQLDRAFSAARTRLRPGGLLVVQPAGNVGNARFFMQPLSALMSRRARAMHAAVQSTAVRHGATYVNLYKEADADPFAQRPELHAADGLHPSDAGYRLWRDELLAQSDLGRRLEAARRAQAPGAPAMAAAALN